MEYMQGVVYISPKVQIIPLPFDRVKDIEFSWKGMSPEEYNPVLHYFGFTPFTPNILCSMGKYIAYPIGDNTQERKIVVRMTADTCLFAITSSVKLEMTLRIY